MAIVFQVNGFCASDTTHIAQVKQLTRFNGYRVNAVISENCNQVALVLRILQTEENPLESLLQWVPLNAMIWIVTPCKIFQIARTKDAHPTIQTLSYKGVFGKDAFPLKLLLRLKISTARAIYLNELIHGHLCKYIKIVRYAHLGIRSRKFVPPVLPWFNWSAYKRP